MAVAAAISAEPNPQRSELGSGDDYAEGSVVSAMLQDEAAIERARSIITERDFTNPVYGALFGAAVRLTDAGTLVDPITVSDLLQNERPAEGVTWKDVAGELCDLVPTSANVEAHARIVAGSSVRRQTASQLGALLAATERNGLSLSELRIALCDVVSQIERIPGSSEPLFYTLQQLYEDPELLRGPEVVVPLLAWGERVTLFAGREKLGKSTYLAFAAACLSTGRPFLGHELRAGRVLWVGLEEHLADAVGRFKKMEADPQNIVIVPRLEHGFESLEQVVGQVQPSWTVVDSLAALTEGIIQDESAPAPWTPVMNRLARIARTRHTSITTSHHATKATGEYRGSTAIAAGVDQILTMTEVPKAQMCRRLTCKGRWFVGDYSVCFDGQAFSVVGSEVIPIDMQVLKAVRDHPTIGKTKIRELVGGRSSNVDSAIADLCSRGLIVRAHDGRRFKGYQIASP